MQVDSIDWQLVGALVTANATASSIIIYLGVHNAGSNPASKEADWHVNYIGCSLGKGSAPDSVSVKPAVSASPQLEYDHPKAATAKTSTVSQPTTNAASQTTTSTASQAAASGGGATSSATSGHHPVGLSATIYIWGLTKEQFTPANQKKMLISTAAAVSLDASQLRLKSFASASSPKKSGVQTEVVMVVDGYSALQTVMQMVGAASFAALMQTELQINQVTNADSLTVKVGKINEFGKKTTSAAKSTAVTAAAHGIQQPQQRLHGQHPVERHIVVGVVIVVGLNVLAMLVYAIKSRSEVVVVSPEGEDDDEQSRLTYGST
jgi:hypothetical protein